MDIYHSILKPLMFQLDAEDAHRITMSLFRSGTMIPASTSVFRKRFTVDDERLRTVAMGIDFPNPVGLAAGFDKDARHIDLIPLLGFGFVEIGTVTPRPQPGNPRPRLFRLKEDEALINRMGFNNEGVMAMTRRLDKRKNKDFVIGGNIGKNKDTPNEEAYKDYVTCYRELRELVDFFVINVSSPNTPGLRELQNKESLKQILGSVQELNSNEIPVLIKIAPDINLYQLDDIMEVMLDTGLEGIVCHNTTIRRDQLHSHSDRIMAAGAGGLSGKPLNEMFSEFSRELGNRLPANKTWIASGGIHDTQSAIEKLKTSANLVEVYTGLIYQGPDFVQSILTTLLNAME